ncbi:MAG: hypothetical protein QHI48_02900 [Bacteroidota bacterium]|nr:hypothetical protein [Bacteroidota bacterium]
MSEMALSPRWDKPAVFAAVYAVVLLAVSWSIGWDRPCWADECHFLRVINDFASRGPAAVVDYDAGASPLVFLLYAGWGTVFGFDLGSLRCLSLLIALATGLVFHLLARTVLGSGRESFFLPFLLLLNPYGAGLSFFVYTDMTMILFLLLATWAAIRGKAVWLCCTSTGALLARQYAAFLVAAVFLFTLFRFVRTRDRRFLSLAIASAVSALPLAGLMAAWGGIAPPRALVPFDGTSPVAFHARNLTLYIALIPVFCFPVIVMRANVFRFGVRTHLFLVALSLIYFLAPIAPSEAALLYSRYETVGLFHRFLVSVLRENIAVHAVWFICFLAGLHVLLALGGSVARNVRGTVDAPDELLLDLAVFSFLVLMAWSYQTWEKYALPMVPLIGLRVLLFPYRSLSERRSGEEHVPF